MTVNSHQQPHLTLTEWLCLTACGIIPFANDIFTSGLPAMADFFKTDHIAITLSAFMAALAIGQLLAGPIFDRFGRRKPLLVSLCIYLLGSFWLTQTNDFTHFLFARFIQGIGASPILIGIIASLRDRFQGHELTCALAKLMAIVGISPSIAPMIGSVLTQTVGWRSNFDALLILGIIYVVVLTFFFKETQQTTNHKALHLFTFIKNIKTLLKNTIYTSCMLAAGLSYGTFFLYLAVSPHFIIADWGYPPLVFGLLGLFYGLIVFISAMLIPKLAKRYGTVTVMIAGASVQILGTALIAVASLVASNSIASLALPMILVTIGFAAIRPLGLSAALQQTPTQLTGLASALFNLFIFAGAALVIGFSGYIDDQLIDTGLLMTAISLLLLYITLQLRRYQQAKNT